MMDALILIARLLLIATSAILVILGWASIQKAGHVNGVWPLDEYTVKCTSSRGWLLMSIGILVTLAVIGSIALEDFISL